MTHCVRERILNGAGKNDKTEFNPKHLNRFESNVGSIVFVDELFGRLRDEIGPEV